VRKKPEDPINIDDFTALDRLGAGYELRTDRTYLIVVGKNFSPQLAEGLFRDIRQYHPDIKIVVAQSLYPKEVAVLEKKEAEIG
jgi:hypothetical protein